MRESATRPTECVGGGALNTRGAHRFFNPTSASRKTSLLTPPAECAIIKACLIAQNSLFIAVA